MVRLLSSSRLCDFDVRVLTGWPNLPVLPKVFLPIEQVCMGNLQASFARYLQFVHGVSLRQCLPGGIDLIEGLQNINKPLQLGESEVDWFQSSTDASFLVNTVWCMSSLLLASRISFPARRCGYIIFHPRHGSFSFDDSL